MDGEEPGQVTEFSYLGGLITEGGQCTNDKKQCCPGIIQIGQDVEDEQYISKQYIKLYREFVTQVLMYGSECRCLLTGAKGRLVAEIG